MSIEMVNADKFWNDAERRVLRIAGDLGIAPEVLDARGDLCDLLYDLFDYGEKEPTDSEIRTGICELLES